MNESPYIDLITGSLQGTLSPEEQERFEALLDRGEIDILEVKKMEMTLRQMGKLDTPEPGPEAGARFHRMLEAEKRRLESDPGVEESDWLASLPGLLRTPKLAWAALLLLCGILIGQWAAPVNDYREQMDELSTEMNRMREVMMMSLLDNESATERLKAVNISAEIPRSEPRITEALLRTLNDDPNINVRIAAIEALLHHAEDPAVREGLVDSISRQSSPLVQAALADAMLLLQEERSVEEFRNLLEQEEVEVTLRDKLENTIAKLS